jgi:hypothetical protein
LHILVQGPQELCFALLVRHGLFEIQLVPKGVFLGPELSGRFVIVTVEVRIDFFVCVCAEKLALRTMTDTLHADESSFTDGL